MTRLYGHVLVRLLGIDADAPESIDAVAERLSRVVGVLHGEQRDAEQRQEGEEDLERQQEVLALAVPDQAEQVAGHREMPPLSASTGLRRDIRHAG